MCEAGDRAGRGRGSATTNQGCRGPPPHLQKLQKAKEVLPRALEGGTTLLTHHDLQLLAPRTARGYIYVA